MSNKNKSVEEVVEKLNDEFMAIIKRFAPNHYAHLIDNDDNDGEDFRDSLREAIQQERQTSQEREREMIEELIEFTFEACPYEGTMMRAFLNNYKATKITNPNKD